MFILPEEQSITRSKTRQSTVLVGSVFFARKRVAPEMAGNFEGSLYHAPSTIGTSRLTRMV